MDEDEESRAEIALEETVQYWRKRNEAETTAFSEAQPYEAAGQLAEMLSKMRDEACVRTGADLSCRHEALLQETIGLLIGIKDGKIRQGQERIRNNIVEILSDHKFYDGNSISPLSSIALAVLRQSLGYASQNGLTVSTCQFHARSQDRSRY